VDGAGYVTAGNWSGDVIDSAYGGIGTTSADWTGFAYINGGQWSATSSLGYANLSDFSATGPLTYNSASGIFAINKASSSANGYLSNTDWTTFNNKWDSLSDMTLSQGYIYVGDGSDNPSATSSLFVDTNGYVGIGTDNPSYLLDVAGNARIGSTGNGTVMARQMIGNGAVYLFASNGGYRMGIDNTGDVSFADAGGNTKILFDLSTGSVGIGTTSPLSKLTVDGNLFLEGANNYLNFGATTSVAEEGYGFRDNGGTMQVRNANGAWANIESGGSGIALTDLSATSPLTYNSGSGVFAINIASSTANGYLTSTDWTTFNTAAATVTASSTYWDTVYLNRITSATDNLEI
ncbi:hypothetical protein C0583_04740, partial [Candidatus Parcubacteria bacterium]